MGFFTRKSKDSAPEGGEALGLILFDEVPEALAAERTLESAGYAISLVAPPHELRAGCDLAIALDRVESVGALRTLDQAGVRVRDWVDDAQNAATVCDLVTTVDFGEWLMVRAGNMKITVEKSTGTIVNTSGGGCPDIPYLNLELVGGTLADTPRPKDLGYTLCGLMLDRAYLEAAQLLEGGELP